MKFFKDEAFQSWIYRCLLVNGVTDLSSVINKNGRWRKVPFFPNEFNALFTHQHDAELVKLFLQSSIELTENIAPNPWTYVEAIKQYFNGAAKHNPKNGSLAIKYCSDCIINSIKNNGFGYIKAEWLYGSYCEVHNTSLSTIQSNSIEESLTLLPGVLAGSYSIQRPASPSERNLIQPPIEGEHFMPCFLMDFYWAASYRHNSLFPEHEYSVFFNINGTRKSMRNFYLGDTTSILYYVRKKLREYARYCPDELEAFIQKRAETVVYKYGVNKPDSFSENLITKKGRDCSKCYQWSKEDFCPINPMIGIFKVNEDNQRPISESNICDRVKMYGA